jgi:hypothetical protein
MGELGSKVYVFAGAFFAKRRMEMRMLEIIAVPDEK